MATLTAGGTSTATLTLDAFASVTVVSDASCVGALTFTSDAQNLLSNKTLKVQNKTYGPFGVPGTLDISIVAGSAAYTINGNTGGFAYDAAGNITGLVVAGGVVLNLGSITNPVTRDSTTGRITAYTQGGVSYTVTYGSFGISTITGGGFTLTQNYATNGIPSGVTLT